jgi:RNA polymerase sigma-70 factor (ECF subfamily)
MASSPAMLADDLAGLVAPAVAGDRGAMRRLLLALGRVVLRTTRRILHTPADAEEAAQEAMIVLVRDLGSLREPAAVTGFASTVAARVALRARRKRDRDRDGRVDLAHASLHDGTVDSPAATVSARQRAERLLALLDRLPEAQAEALVMRYVLGHEPSEIADATQTPVNTVRSRIRLARASLARQLQADPELHRDPKEAPHEHP